MSKKDNLTIFFVKPPFFHLRKDIFSYLRGRLLSEDQIETRVQPTTSSDFYSEFYADVANINSRNFNIMVNEYPRISDGRIDLALISGRGVTQRVKDFVGPTVYEDNIGKETLREFFGPYSLPDTVVHASKPSEMQRDLSLIRKYSLI